MDALTFEDLNLIVARDGYATLELARSHRSNAFTEQTLASLTQALNHLSQSENIRAVVLRGQGRNFCAGIDLASLDSVVTATATADGAQTAAEFTRKIRTLQEAFNAIERCRWPVIAAVQGACVGGGLDLAAACDIRICSQDAFFSLKEVDLGITADLGSLQRLPGIIGHGATMEWALTGRAVPAAEGKQKGLVSEILSDLCSLHARADELAAALAQKSPLALAGIKRVTLHARDSRVEEGLEYVAVWNGSLALSGNLKQGSPQSIQTAPLSRL